MAKRRERIVADFQVSSYQHHLPQDYQSFYVDGHHDEELQAHFDIDTNSFLYEYRKRNNYEYYYYSYFWKRQTLFH